MIMVITITVVLTITIMAAMVIILRGQGLRQNKLWRCENLVFSSGLESGLAFRQGLIWVLGFGFRV